MRRLIAVSKMTGNLIYDVGAHKGEDTEFYLLKGFRVVAVEAVPELCDEIRARLHSYVASGQLTLINAAIADRTGPVTFFVNRHVSVFGTTNENWARRNDQLLGAPSDKTTVAGMRFSDILTRYGVPYYLKIDIEGSDLECLRELESFPSKPKYVSLESATVRWSDAVDELSILRGLGYSKFKFVEQLDVPKQRCPNPPTEGRYVDHHFNEYASGLFGAELPGEWLSEGEALRAYRFIFLRFRLFGDESLVRRSRSFRFLYNRLLSRWSPCRIGWYDTHATI